MKSTPFLLLLVAAVSGCTKSNPAAPVATTAPKAIVVHAVPVGRSTAAIPIQASGIVARRTEAELSFKIVGVIEEVAVRAGDRVTKGQVLARLQLEEIEAQVGQARSAVEKARRDLARTEKLQAAAVATLENLPAVRTALEQAEAQLRIAEFNRRHAIITAPAAGRVLRRLAEPNELVTAGHAVLTLAADDDGWIVRAGLSEREVGRMRLGDSAEITLPGTGQTAVPGRVVQISEAADSLTRTTPVEIALDALRCPPADSAVGHLSGGEKRRVALCKLLLSKPDTLHPQPVAARPVVPASALIEGAGDSASLYLIPPGAATTRRLVVKVEALFGTEAYLGTALPPGAQVVAFGAEFLRDGAPITLAAQEGKARPVATSIVSTP